MLTNHIGPVDIRLNLTIPLGLMDHQLVSKHGHQWLALNRLLGFSDRHVCGLESLTIIRSGINGEDLSGIRDNEHVTTYRTFEKHAWYIKYRLIPHWEKHGRGQCE